MKRPSIYVKMKVLGAIDVVEGKTRDERIHNVAGLTFLDEVCCAALGSHFVPDSCRSVVAV